MMKVIITILPYLANCRQLIIDRYSKVSSEIDNHLVVGNDHLSTNDFNFTVQTYFTVTNISQINQTVPQNRIILDAGLTSYKVHL